MNNVKILNSSKNILLCLLIAISFSGRSFTGLTIFNYRIGELIVGVLCVSSLFIFFYKNQNYKVLLCRPWVAQKIGILFKHINWIGQNLFENGRIFKNQVIDYLHLNKSKVFYFDEEGGVYSKELASKIFKQRYSKKNLTDEDIIFAWGNKQSEILKSMDLQSYKLGHLRFLQKKFNHKIKDNTVLIMTNFSIAFSSMSFADRYFDKKIYKSRLNGMLKEISNLFKIINEIDSEKEIHIRPHPSEDIEVYKILFRNYPNVYIRDNEDLNESFIFANKFYHFDCTTALDAHCLGIKSINIGSNPNTIIEDIESDLLISDWIEYPCRSDDILEIIINNSINSKISKKKFCLLVATAYLLESLFLIKEAFNRFSYEKNKFGNFYLSKGLFKVKLM